MLKRFVCLLLLLFVRGRLFAQHADDGYYPYADYEEPAAVLLTDSTLFYRAIRPAGDRYGERMAFLLPAVSVRRRGAGHADGSTRLGDLEIGSRHAAGLAMLGARESRSAGIAAEEGSVADLRFLRHFGFDEREPLRPRRLALSFSGRNYLVGARASAVRSAGGWLLTALADGRTGRDLWVEGLFSQSLTAAFHARGPVGRGSRMEFTLLLPLGLRGLRSSSSQEAFALTGEKLYNPSWGFQCGKVRNSRVKRTAMPLLAGAWSRRIAPNVELRVEAALEFGRESVSALGWYDAPTPMPDNYRYMPSFSGDPAAERAWRLGDTRYTQVCWDALIARNRLGRGAAVYALEARVERLLRPQAAVRFVSRISPRTTLRCGARVWADDSRRFKQVRDLLGADYLTDIDTYLLDDDSYGSMLQNDLRHPDRHVRRGERFGYDYSMRTYGAEADLQVTCRVDRLHVDLQARLGHASVVRCGHYEKEIFPGRASLGASRRLGFRPYAFALQAGWACSARLYAGVAGAVAARMPQADELFFQPLYNNLAVPDPRPVRSCGLEALLRMTGERFDLRVAAFASMELDRSVSRRYYDDLSGRYCDMAIRGIGRSACGVEVLADLSLAYRWRLLLAASAGRYRHIRDPRVTVVSDRDGTPVDTDAVSRMGGCRTGMTPGATAAGELSWFGPRGWSVRLSAGWMSSRYVEAEPLRRTDRVAGAAGVSREDFEALVRQEALSGVVTLDASLFRTFRFGSSQLRAGLLLRNLTGMQAVSSAYESLRVRRFSSADATGWRPHASRYLYAWPRTVMLTAAYEF